MNGSRNNSCRSSSSSGLRLFLSLAILVSLHGCDGRDASIDDREATSDRWSSQHAPLQSCPRPDEGCACLPGSEPIDCYRAPSESPSGKACGIGKRYCRAGKWSACDDVQFIELSRRNAYIAPGFQHCDLFDPDLGVLGCNPDCFIAEDTPNPWDLSAQNSDDSIYRSNDPTDPPGIYLGTPDAAATPIDSDGDGFPDVVDACPHTPGDLDSSGNFGCPSGNGIGIYVEADGSVGATPGTIVTPYLNWVPSPPLDVYFLFDTSVTHIGIDVVVWSNVWELTMDQPIDALRTHFDTFDSILRGAVPNVQYGVGAFNEYQAWTRYGDPNSNALPYRHYQSIGNHSVAQMKNFLLTARNNRARGSGNSGNVIDFLDGSWNADIRFEQEGFDWTIRIGWPPVVFSFTRLEFVMPESHTQALWSVATREGLRWTINPVSAATGSCAGGGFGYPCFRANAVPVVVLVTDDAQHNGPSASTDQGRYPYDKSYPPLAYRGGGAVNIQSLSGNGRFNNPRTFPSGPHNYFRRFRGSTENTSRDQDSVPCGSNWDGNDETSQFTITQEGPYRLRVEREGFSGGLLGNDQIGVAVYRPNGSVAVCAKGNGPHEWVLDLSPGTYKIRIDGGRGTLWHARGTYSIYFGAHDPPSVDYVTVREALKQRGIRVVGLHGCTQATIAVDGIIKAPSCAEQSIARTQLRDLAFDTDGLSSLTGQPIVPSVNVGAGGAANAISQLAEGIKTMIQETHSDVIIRALDNPSTPFDEREFIQDLSLTMASGPLIADCAPMNAANATAHCSVPTGIEFHADVKVEVKPGAAPPGLYEFEVEVRSVADDTRLALIPVKVLIRPEVVLEPGSYWRDYDASIFDPSIPAGAPLCEIGGETGLRPDWLNLRWVADTPSNSSGGSFIEFNLKTADSSSGLGSGSDVCVRIPETAPHKSGCVRLPADGANARLDVGRALVDAGSANYRHLLRVTSTLYPTPDGQLTPFLYDMSVSYACTPFE